MESSLFGRLARLPVLVRVCLLLASGFLVGLASSYSGDGGPSSFVSSYITNLLHVPLYAQFSLCVLFLMGPSAPRQPKTWLFIPSLILVLGFMDEWHQLSVPGRSSSWIDIVSDLIGSLLALAYGRWACRPLHWPTLLHLLLLSLVGLSCWGFFPMLAPDLPLPFISS